MRRWTRRLGWLLLVLLVVYVILAILAEPAEDRPIFATLPDTPLVIAHQGGEHLRPSNTMAAFDHAVALGVDMLELDVHSSADNVLVTIHDDTVDRTTDGTGRVNDLTLDQLKALDAGDYWTDDEGATYPYRGQGITIATLEEVFQAHAPMPMNIEIKQESPSIAQPFCDLLREYDMLDRVLVASFRQQAMDDFRAECPSVATSAVEAEVRQLFYLHLAYSPWLHSPTAQAVQVPKRAAGFHILTERFVRNAQRRNLEVHAWTINERADMEHLLAIGVDGIITDRPDILLDVVGR